MSGLDSTQRVVRVSCEIAAAGHHRHPSCANHNRQTKPRGSITTLRASKTSILHAPRPPPSSEPARTNRHLLDIGVDAAQLHGPAARQVVHGREGDVEAGSGVVDSQHVDRLAVVRRAPARAAVGRVPPADRLGAADVWEALYVLLDVPEYCVRFGLERRGQRTRNTSCTSTSPRSRRLSTTRPSAAARGRRTPRRS